MQSNTNTEAVLHDLLTAIRPWLDQEQSFLADLAKHQWSARLVLATVLMESEKFTEAAVLLQSIIQAPLTEQDDQENIRPRAMVELAHLKMEELKYDEAEALLWDVRNRFIDDKSKLVKELEFSKEDISLLIAQCRFGQGFIQDAIDRAGEIVHKLQSIDAGGTRLAKAHQQIGWFYLHKSDVPAALTHMKKAMKLAPQLDRDLVDAGLEAERSADFEKAVEYYFDSIQLDG